MSTQGTKWLETAASQVGAKLAARRERSLAGIPDRLCKFARRDEGSVMPIFGLMAVTMCVMVGGAVDLGRFLTARDQTIAAIDAAVLAAGAALQSGATIAQAQQVAMSYYKINTKNRIDIPQGMDTVGFAISSDKSTVKATGNVSINTPFIAILDGFINDNHNKLALFRSDEAPEATTRSQEDLNKNREIALMLDVSGSMGASKMAAMKAAAKDLVNIVLKDNPNYWTKVALIPFSNGVRPPSGMMASITPTQTATGSSSPGCTTAWPEKRCMSNGGGWGGGGTTTYTKVASCPAERSGAEKYTDALPSPTSNYINSAYNQSSSSTSCDTPSASIIRPLSSNKATITSQIDGLANGSGTAGHIGTAWTYYMLSPKWAPLLTGAAKPAAYGLSDTKKTAILMTDGEYNFTYDVKGLDRDADHYAGSANGKTSAQQAVLICNEMKQDGIEVYTVGFDLGGNQTAINTLKACATDETMAYITNNGNQLQQAFRDIAIKLTELHLLR